MNVLDRFLKKITINENGCWLWTASKDRTGYARFNLPGAVQAHRWLYAYFHNDIDKSQTLDHLCRIRHCVNPTHLEQVSNKVNVLRGIGISAMNKGKTQCLRGHAYTKENTDYQTYSYGIGRSCKTCRRHRCHA